MNDKQPIEYLKFRKIDEKALQILITGECYFPNPEKFNDPMDCAYSCKNFPDDLQKHIKNDHSAIVDADAVFSTMLNKDYIKTDKYGVLSLSAVFDDESLPNPQLNPAHWAYYADNHRGICIGFSPQEKYHEIDISPLYKNSKNDDKNEYLEGVDGLMANILSHRNEIIDYKMINKFTIRPVRYVNEFVLPEPDWDKVRENYFKKKNEGYVFKDSKKLISTILKETISAEALYLTKHSAWSHENEFRVFGKADESQFLNSEISSITFGMEVYNSTIRYIIKLLSRIYGHNISLYKMTVKNGRFQKVPLNKNDGKLNTKIYHVPFNFSGFV